MSVKNLEGGVGSRRGKSEFSTGKGVSREEDSLPEVGGIANDDIKASR